MSTRKALTDEQIAEVRRRYAAGESKCALSRAFYVSDVTIANYVRDVNRDDNKADPEPIHESKSEPQPETSDLYETARGFEIFVKNHTTGDFFISVSRSAGVTFITAAAGDEEITIKRSDEKQGRNETKS